MGTKSLTTSIAAAAALLGAAVLLKAAQHAGLLGADASDRSLQAFFGLMVAAYGNFIPKKLGRMRGTASETRVQKALRVSGWAFVLAGLSYAALTLFAPPAIGSPASIAVMVLAIAVTLVVALRCMWTTRVSAMHGE